MGAPGADVDREKRIAAERSAGMVEDGMRVGLGTGSTVAFVLPALAARRIDLRCVATSVATHELAHQVGLQVEPFEGADSLDHLDMAIDGADQVDGESWVVKGGGAAHTREKRVASAAERFVVIVDSGKLVDRVQAPVPLELMDFGLAATLRDLRSQGDVTLRDVPRSPDGGVIADFHGDVRDPATLAAWLDSLPGVVAHGLFPPSMTTVVLIGRGDQVEVRPVS